MRRDVVGSSGQRVAVMNVLPNGRNIEMANIHNKSLVVQVYGDATSGSLFRSFQGLEV
jgi:hypothetical protein